MGQRGPPLTAAGPNAALITSLLSFTFLTGPALFLRIGVSEVSWQAHHTLPLNAAESWFRHGVAKRTQVREFHGPGVWWSQSVDDYVNLDKSTALSGPPNWPVGFPLDSGNARVNNRGSLPSRSSQYGKEHSQVSRSVVSKVVTSLVEGRRAH